MTGTVTVVDLEETASNVVWTEVTDAIASPADG